MKEPKACINVSSCRLCGNTIFFVEDCCRDCGYTQEDDFSNYILKRALQKQVENNG